MECKVLHLNIGIEANIFADRLTQEITTGGLTVVDAIEKLLGENLEDSVLISFGNHIIKTPLSIVHPSYYINRFENLACLSQQGYFTWYPEVRFSTQKNIHLEITQVEATGIELGYIKYGGGIERQYTYRRKELKTQVNHTVRFNKISIPPDVFGQTKCGALKVGSIKQPYIANLTVGCRHFVDDRIEGFRIVAFDHVLTGERRFCHCHSEAHAAMLSDAKKRASSYVPDSWPHHFINLLEHAIYTEGICHFCISEQHGEDAPIEWYGNQIYKHFYPYVDLLVRDRDMDSRTAKAEAKRRLSIGRWVREEELFQLISKLFPTKTIRREASPKWLGQQRLDIYIPELALAIEHQGEQHYRPIDVFGGEPAFANTQKRDQRKRALCEGNNVTVVEVRYDEPLTLTSLRSRLRRWLTKDDVMHPSTHNLRKKIK